jgi:HlyD family secretion protein
MKRKKAVKIVIAVVLVAGIIIGGIFAFFSGGSASGAATSYEVLDLTTGSLQQSITGTGTLAVAGTTAITTPVEATITEYTVSAGDRVSAGDAVAKVDTSSMDSAIATLESEIDSLDSTINNLSDSLSTTQTVSSTLNGRVKLLYAEAGDQVADIMAENGALMVLSTDGKMKLQIEARDLEVGDSVSVTAEETSYTGTVVKVSSDTATITITDNGPSVGAEAAVYDGDGTQIGSGTLEISAAVSVTADEGTVSAVYVSENSKVYEGTSLLYLKNISTTDAYERQVALRAEKQEALESAKLLQQSGEIVSTVDGIVAEISGQTGVSLQAGGQVLSLYSGAIDSLTVSVDELDIQSVEVGDSATVTVDAIDDTTYNATVQSISQVGSVNSGITSYSVVLQVETDELVKIGMNATATIIIEESENALLVPLEALQSSQGEQYVWLYTGSLPEDSSEDPGTRTVVTTGLSNDSYAEVLSGLSEGDQVVVVRTKSTSGTSETSGEGGFMGGMMGGDSMGDMSQDGERGGSMGNMPQGGGSMGDMPQN